MYSNSPAGNTFGVGSYLISGNDAYWGSDIVLLPPVDVGPGNRYVFKDSLTMTISLNNDPTKVYGNTIDSSNYVSLYLSLIHI